MYKTHTKRALIALFALCALSIATSGTLAEEKEKSGDEKKTEAPVKIDWLNYEDALKLASETDKQVLIDFTTKTCGWCRRMEREAFADKRVIDYVNENFVATKVWGDSRRELTIDGFTTSEWRIAQEMYRVRGYPTFWFLESDGSKIGQQPGYQKPDGFLSLLQFVKDRKYEEQKSDKQADAESGR